MKKSLAIMLSLLGGILSTLSTKSWSDTQDAGLINTLFFTNDGAVAFTLKDGFSNAVNASECSISNGSAGLIYPDPNIVAALMQAKATQQKITVRISGCEPGVNWYRIVNLTLN